MNIIFQIEKVDALPNNAVACVHYPHEPTGPKIQVIKGLNAIEFSEAIHHEIGHIFDWYLGGQSTNVDVREQNATIIGESIRYRQSSPSMSNLMYKYWYVALITGFVVAWLKDIL